MKLSFFEKFYLRRRGKRDGKKNLFQRCNLDELYSSDEDVADKQVCISSFIVRELSRLNGEVNFVFRFSLCNPQFDETVPKDTEAKDDNKMVKQKKQWRIMRLKKGMEWCDKEITKIYYYDLKEDGKIIKVDFPKINWKEGKKPKKDSFFDMFDEKECQLEESQSEVEFIRNDFLPNILEFYMNFQDDSEGENFDNYI